MLWISLKTERNDCSKVRALTNYARLAFCELQCVPNLGLMTRNLQMGITEILTQLFLQFDLWLVCERE